MLEPATPAVSLWSPSLLWEQVVMHVGFPGSSACKESFCNAGVSSSIGERRGYPFQFSWPFLVAQIVKNPPALWETWVPSLGWKDPLEEGMQPTPVFLPGESPWTEELGRLQSMGILQARILEWVVMPSSRGSFQPRDQIQFYCIAGRFFTFWATREAQQQSNIHQFKGENELYMWIPFSNLLSYLI